MPLVANNSPAVGHHYANQKNAHLQQGSNILDLTCFFFCLFFSRFLDLEHCNGVALQNLSSPLRKKSLSTKKFTKFSIKNLVQLVDCCAQFQFPGSRSLLIVEADKYMYRPNQIQHN
jgi:hypothetical protein